MGIYMDYAATAPLRAEALEAMMPYLTGVFGNASGMHAPGREARKAIEDARAAIAGCIGARPEEVYFTSGGSESDTWALLGTWDRRGKGKNRLIASAVEHHAVLNACGAVEARGGHVSLLRPDPEGRILPENVLDALREDTFLVSVMTANNEIGTVEPVERIGEALKGKGVLFHTDAVQALGLLPVRVDRIGCDLLSASAHKFYGPKGIGFLYVREGTPIGPLIRGGMQERGRRPGTENTAAIVGMAAALECAVREMEETRIRLEELRDRLTGMILSGIPGTHLNGPAGDRLPGNVNVRFDGVDGALLLMRLDMAGIYASAGAACTAGLTEPSHVLRAIGLGDGEVQSAVRFSLGRGTTAEEIAETAETLKRIVKELRNA